MTLRSPARCRAGRPARELMKEGGTEWHRENWKGEQITQTFSVPESPSEKHHLCRRGTSILPFSARLPLGIFIFRASSGLKPRLRVRLEAATLLLEGNGLTTMSTCSMCLKKNKGRCLKKNINAMYYSHMQYAIQVRTGFFRDKLPLGGHPWKVK